MAASGAALAGCAARGTRNDATLQPPLDLPKVRVAPEREIRTIVGLRPFRPAGFRVAAEKIGARLCVHNYGHGGAGITLSWGTAQRAAEIVRESGCRDVAVIGCGAVGLATARLLQRMGKTVAIYAKALPPFPRRDGIVLGGTVVRGDWSLQPDLEAKQRIVAAHQRLFRGP